MSAGVPMIPGLTMRSPIRAASSSMNPMTRYANSCWARIWRATFRAVSPVPTTRMRSCMRSDPVSWLKSEPPAEDPDEEDNSAETKMPSPIISAGSAK